MEGGEAERGALGEGVGGGIGPGRGSLRGHAGDYFIGWIYIKFDEVRRMGLKLTTWLYPAPSYSVGPSQRKPEALCSF